MKKVSNEFIDLSKKPKQQNAKLTVVEETIAQEVRIVSDITYYNTPISILKESNQIIAKEVKYSFEGELFKTIMKQIEITVKNAAIIKEKNINFQYGLYKNDGFEYVDLGDFYIKDVEDDKNKEELVVTGYDKMLNFMKTFKQSELQLTYPCELKELVNRIGEVCRVELYSTDFFNSNLIVDEDFFTIQQLTYRDVLEKVAQTTLTTIFIKDNKLYLCKVEDSVQTLDTSFLSNLVIKEKFGPVNALVLGRGNVEDNIEEIDVDSINENGRCEIRFDENEFLDNKRTEVIRAMLQEIKGLEYYAFEASDLGILWLEPCDVIKTIDREGNEYKTIYLKASVTINTGIRGEMEASIPESTTTEYKVTTKEQKKALKTERLAKKNEGLIKDIIEENTKTINKLSEVEHTVDDISQKVEYIEDFTKEKTQIENLYLDDIAEGEGYLLSLIVNGNTNYFENKNITICASTKPRGYGETIYLTTENEEELLTEDEQKFIVGNSAFHIASINLILNDVLRSLIVDEETYYDTLEIAQDGTIRVIRKIGVDSEGNCYLLNNEVIETLEEKFVLPSLKNGTYYFVEENPYLQYYSKYIVENDYSNTFLTKLELGTKITQNVESIKYAWNQISQYLQMEGIDGKATLNIYDKDNKLLMSLSKDGQTFFDESGKNIGSIGVVRENAKSTLAFTMPVDWKNVDNSRTMAWGIEAPDGKFLPIFYLAGYYGDNNSEYGGELVVEGRLSVPLLKIIKGIVLQHFNQIQWGEDGTEHIEGLTNDDLRWLAYSSGYGHDFMCGEEHKLLITNNGVVMPNEFNNGVIMADGKAIVSRSEDNISMDTDGTYIWVYVNGVYRETLGTEIDYSDKKLKKNIKNANKDALNKIMRINHKEFDWQKNDKHQDIGYIAQELEEIDENFVIHVPMQGGDELLKVNTLNILSATTKAMQEQQKQIEQLQKRDNQKNDIINNLIKRIEQLERRYKWE